MWWWWKELSWWVMLTHLDEVLVPYNSKLGCLFYRMWVFSWIYIRPSTFNSVTMALFSGMRPSPLASVDKSNFSTEQNVSLFCYNQPKFNIFLANNVLVWKENLLGLPLKRKQMVVAASPPREDVVVSAEPLTKEDLVDYLASGCKPKEMWW